MKLRQLRQDLRLTQKEFASKINIRQSLVSLWESGRKVPEAVTIRKINALFNWDLNRLDFEKTLKDEL